MFNWNPNIVLRVLFRLWRKPKFIAFVKALVSPLVLTFARFSEFRSLWLYRLMFTDQVIYLEHFLNGEYSLQYDLATRNTDISNRTIIYILNADFIESDNIFFVDEQQPSMDTYFRLETLVAGSPPPTTSSNVYFEDELNISTHFTVLVPAHITYDEQRMRAQIDFYLKAGKQYTITTY